MRHGDIKLGPKAKIETHLLLVEPKGVPNTEAAQSGKIAE